MQTNILFGDMHKNFDIVSDTLMSNDCGEIVLLPELWSSSYDLENTVRICEENAELLIQLRQLASLKKVFLGGSLLEARAGEVYNTFHLIDPSGDICADYQKIHLFRLLNEEKWMSPGSKFITIDFPWGRAGLAICYDLRFPELFRRYALMGCKMILLVAEWPLRRIQHWKILLQARAIENQLFIAAVNTVGQSGDYVYSGTSLIINPWGEVLAEGSLSQPDLVQASIDLSQVQRVRKSMPVFEDRRLDLYT